MKLIVYHHTKNKRVVWMTPTYKTSECHQSILYIGTQWQHITVLPYALLQWLILAPNVVSGGLV